MVREINESIPPLIVVPDAQSQKTNRLRIPKQVSLPNMRLMSQNAPAIAPQ
jgi:hypothetical protein